MERIREEFDADRSEEFARESKIRTELHDHAVPCSICFATLYVDKETSDHISRAIEAGLDNPFICSECSEEYEEAAAQRGGAE